MLNTLAQLTIAASLLNTATAQPWGTWQDEGALPTNGAAKAHAFGLELDGTIFILGGTPWMNPSDQEDATVYSRPINAPVWTEEIGFDGYGYVLGQRGGVDALGRIIIFGGDDPSEPGNFDKPPFEWNTLEGPWHEHADRGSQAPPSNFAFCTDDAGRIYSLGGGPGESATPANPNSTYCERYIGPQELWEQIAPMPIALSNAAATIDGLGHILVFGGVSPDGFSRTNEVLQYDLATNSWSTTANANMPVALSDHEATLGADGRIYILGGSSGPIGAETVMQTVHVYHPATDQWATAPDMTEPRRHFASFLGTDDRIYVAGGDNFSGGSFNSESIYTTPCPQFTSEPADTTVWNGGVLNLSVSTIGGGTITYQWMLDGQPLTDGLTEHGSEITGAQSASLRVESATVQESGTYSVIATNGCGSIQSNSYTINVQVPAILPENWVWTSLHPSYAERSFANGVDNGVQVGSAVFDTPEYNGIDHPTRWTGTAASATNLTPSGSQGGNILDFTGEKLVGWWWEPIQCYVNHQWQTCYFRRGCWWELDGTFHDTSYSGYEYTLMSATDGSSIVGTGTTDDEVGNVYSKAVIWQLPTHYSAFSIHPSGFRGSSLSAVDGEYQYGTVSLPFQGLHAAMWMGSSSSFVDLHPLTAINSSINAASHGQQVGVINQWNSPHAVIWSNSIESLVDINPAGALESTLTECDSGLQIGHALFDDGLGSHPGIWAGSAESFVDLTPVVPVGYSGFNMAAIDVADDGTIQIVGNSWNVDAQRSEAILITSTNQPVCIADFNQDEAINLQDIFAYLDAFNASDPIADFTNDGIFNLQDLFAYLDEFNAGCPE